MKHLSAEAILATWLPAVHQDPAQVRQFQLLHGGVSGSYVFRLEGFSQPSVLKITLASTPSYVRERARREIAFYQLLAANLPISVPHVHGTFVNLDDGGSALLLRAYAPPAPPAVWTAAMFGDVARQLAQLHATYWDATAQLAAFPWLRQHAAIAPQTVSDAHQSWQALQRKPPFRALFTAPRLRLLSRLLQRVAHAPTNTAALPLTLCHHDVHMNNLLRDERHEIVWADWQEVGIGYGADDLSFFYQRATSDGATVPLEAMLATYREHLMARTGQTVDERALRSRVANHELLTRLLHWPTYLLNAEPVALAAQLDRIEQLAAAEAE